MISVCMMYSFTCSGQILIIFYYHTSSKGNLKLHNIMLRLVWPPGKIMTLISFSCKLIGPCNVNFLFALSIISTLVLGSESHVHCRTPTNQQLIGWPSFEKINGPIWCFHIIMWLDLQQGTISCILAYFKEAYSHITMHNQNQTWVFMEDMLLQQ